MDVREAQKQVRTVYLGGLVGQLVSASIWAASAAVATAGSMRAGAVTLVVAGFFIFPLTQLVLRVIGRPASLPAGNPLRGLAIQVAIVAPLMVPLAAAAALHRIEWFYPAMMLAVGAHYLPFAFLYGMRHFLALGTLMMVPALLVGAYAPELSLAAAWLTAALLAAFAVIGFVASRGRRRESGQPREPGRPRGVVT
jgi:hypothetical protein